MGNFYVFLSTFFVILLAELGDKTQLAVLSLSIHTKAPFIVFLGASISLSLLSLIGAYFGTFLLKLVPRDIIEKIAGLVFILAGIFMILKKN
ncbi:MAG: TMEM165/GDT1 family protein [Dictyoglomaceae bacterium]|nr:TMEM165/GDT1 family protein [Dictyoglomaceae bacterium]